MSDLSPRLAGGIFSLCPHLAFSLGLVSLLIILLGHKPFGLGPTLMTSFNLNSLCKGPVPRHSHVLRYWGQDVKVQILEGTQPLTGPILPQEGPHSSFLLGV